MFAVYSYSFFITLVNEAIVQFFVAAALPGATPFFAYGPITENINYYTPTTATPTVYFTKNLFPYLGEGFNSTWWYVKPPLITDDVFSLNVESNPLIQETVVILSTSFIKTVQEYKAISSWASINRILFVSNKLPVRREFYPMAGNDGIINNFANTQAYENLLSMNIICSFLFASTNAGDYRTNLVYSSATVDTADTIELTNSGMIRELDVEVKWSDKYGNVYPVRLSANKQVNIRFAFIQKL